MANSDSVGQLYGDSFSNYRIGIVRATALNTAGNAAVAIPILGGGLTNGGATANSGGVIVRRVTVQNPNGSLASANISVGVTNNGANLVTSNTVISGISGVGTFADLTTTATYVSGATTQCLYVNVNTAAGNSNTVDIVVWGDVVSF